MATWVLLAMLVVTGEAIAQASEPALVAHYSFDEGRGDIAKDLTGNGNDGKIVGAKYQSLGPGKGYAMWFDTADAYVDCGAGPDLNITGAFTIELWLYPETRQKTGEAGLVGKDHGSYLLSYSPGLWFYVMTGSSQRSGRTDLSGRADVGGWHHLVGTFDGETARLYCDGKLSSSKKTKAPDVNRSTKSLRLRDPVVWGDKVEPTFKCMMDEVRIYRGALSQTQVGEHYSEEVKQRENFSRTEAVQLEYRVLAPTSTLVVEADFSRMDLQPAGAVLRLELRELNGGKIVARHEQTELPVTGKALCFMSVKGLTLGEYDLRAQMMDNGVRIGVASAAKVKLSMKKPAWAAAYDQVKVLNNFTAELLAVRAAQKQAQKTYEFYNPRDGWIFISSMATTQGTDKVFVSLDSPAATDAVIVHAADGKQTLEAMRHIPAGAHKLHVRCEGAARPTELVVRAIPSIIPAEVGYFRAPLVQPAYGPYTWEYLEGINLLRNGNVLIERTAMPENAEHLAQWRRQGKQVLKYDNIHWIPKPITADVIVASWLGEGQKPFDIADYDGVIVDEFASNVTAEQYLCFAEAVKRIAANPKFKGKAIYAYSVHLHRYLSRNAKPFVDALMNAGYLLSEERYVAAQPTEQAARKFLNEHLRQNMRHYKEAFPQFDARYMSMNLGFMSGPPESSDIYPGVDYKVYLDMQMNLLANDPTFFGLNGLQWYHIGYVDEEILRWGTKLLRHYCIEGKMQRLTSDPYLLTHIANGDFDRGAAGWTVESAEDGSAAIRRAPGYGFLQGRYGGNGTGDTLLVTKRSEKRPNRISQTIKNLTPGRTYSVTMLITDYADYRSGKSVVVEQTGDSARGRETVPLAIHDVVTKQIDQPHHASVHVENVDLLPARSFRVVFGSGLCGHEYGPFDRQNQLFISYRRDVFRAREATAELTITDWADDNGPAGPLGQQLGFNFIQVQPYLEP